MHSTRPLAPIVSVIGLSDHVMGLVRAAIRTEAQLPDRSTTYEAGLDDVFCRGSAVALVGLDLNRRQAIELGQALIREHRGIRLIAISEQEHRAGVLEAMRAGFSEYLLLPEESETLRRCIHRRDRSSTHPHHGRALAILGTKGGCGVSTVTVHLAAQLAGMHRVCAVDMDFGMGDVAAMLRLEPESSILDLFSKLPVLSQRELLASVAVHPSHVHVLPQPSFPEDPGHLTRAQLGSSEMHQLLDLLQETYQYIVLDCSGDIDLPTLIALRRADQVWLLCTPDVLSVRNTWRRMRLLDQLGISRDRLKLVVNRWRESAPLSIEQIEANLEISVAARIREDRSNVEQAVTRGVLLRDLNTQSPAHIDIAQSVSLITETGPRAAPVGDTETA